MRTAANMRSVWNVLTEPMMSAPSGAFSPVYPLTNSAVACDLDEAGARLGLHLQPLGSGVVHEVAQLAVHGLRALGVKPDPASLPQGSRCGQGLLAPEGVGAAGADRGMI